jgi:hypothetical protein
MSEVLPVVTKIPDYILLKQIKFRILGTIKIGVFILYVDVIHHGKSV